MDQGKIFSEFVQMGKQNHLVSRLHQSIYDIHLQPFAMRFVHRLDRVIQDNET
jgi:hypothetical protein